MEVEKIVIKIGTIKSTTPYNTCNAWGFGGRSGKLIEYSSGVQYLNAKSVFRHAKPQKNISLYLPFNFGSHPVHGLTGTETITKLIGRAYNVWEYKDDIRIEVAETNMPERYKLVAKIDLVK